MATTLYNPFTRRRQRKSEGGLTGSGTLNRVTKWLSSTKLGSSSMTDDGTTVTFDSNIAFTSTSKTIAGIENQDLLDRTVDEQISGSWTFNSSTIFNSDVTFNGLAFHGDQTVRFRSSYIEYIGGPTYYGTTNLYHDNGRFYITGTRDTGNPTVHIQSQLIVEGNTFIDGNLSFDSPSDKIAGIQNQNLLDKTASETITGTWHFDAFPYTPSSTPTDNYHVANKKYVDDSAVSDHSALTNLNWSAAGHTFDTDLKIGNYKFVCGSGDKLEMYHNGTSHFFNNNKAYGIGDVIFQYDGYYDYYGTPSSTTYFKFVATGDYGEYARLELKEIKLPTYSDQIKFGSSGYISLKDWKVYDSGPVQFTSVGGFFYKSTYSGDGTTVFKFSDKNNKPVFYVYATPSNPDHHEVRTLCTIRGANSSAHDKFSLGYSSIRWKDVWASQNVGYGTLMAQVKIVTSSDSPYSVDEHYGVILCDCSGGAITINLDTAVDGLTFQIKKIDSSSNAVTINAASGDTIEGSSSYTLSSQWDKVVLIYDDTNSRWTIWN